MRALDRVELERFVRERRPRWTRLDALLRDVERLPDHEVGARRLLELVRLYRQTSSDLIEARGLTAHPPIIDRLNGLVGRGYRFVYRRSRARQLGDAVKRLFTVEAPRAFRAESGSVLLAAGTFLLGALLGGAAVLHDRANAELLIPESFFVESPRDRVERIEKSDERIASLAQATGFAAFLFSHNIRVTLLVFSLGAVTIVGGMWVLFSNGVLLGAVAASYFLDGVHVFFLAWVGPHGALEIPAIVFGGAAGLRLGRAFLLPGELSPRVAVSRALPSVWRMLTLTAGVLVLAGIIEGSFSQFSAQTVPYALKIGTAGLLLLGLIAYLFVRRLPGSERPS